MPDPPPLPESSDGSSDGAGAEGAPPPGVEGVEGVEGAPPPGVDTGVDPAVVTLAVEIVETVTVVLVAVEIAEASVLLEHVPEHPLLYRDVSETPESVITKVTVAARLLEADELIAMPVLYEEHGEVHAPTATP